MGKRQAKIRHERVGFSCADCEGPLEPYWNNQEGLMKINRMNEPVEDNGRYTYCPHCGHKNWYPVLFVR